MILEKTSCQSFFREELERRIKANPRYSQRAFARDLGLSAGELSEVMRGKRKLSLKSTLKISRSLGLTPLESRHLGFLVQAQNETQTLNRPLLEPHSLTLDKFNIVSDWYCFAILSLVDCEGFRWSPKWIAKRLGITPLQVSSALDRLTRVGVLKKTKTNFEINHEHVFSPEGIPSEAIRNYHRQILNKAAAALDLQKTTEREISGVSFAFDPALLPSIKKEINLFLDGLATKYSKGKHRQEVYHCEMALFRLSEPEDRQ